MWRNNFVFNECDNDFFYKTGKNIERKRLYRLLDMYYTSLSKALGNKVQPRANAEAFASRPTRPTLYFAKLNPM